MEAGFGAEEWGREGGGGRWGGVVEGGMERLY